MAALNAKRRNALPDSKFAGPDRSYPVDTPGRAANAKARATQAVNAGRMSKSEEAKIDAKANRKLGKSGKKDPPKKKGKHHKLDEALHKAAKAAGWGGIAGVSGSGSGVGGV